MKANVHHTVEQSEKCDSFEQPHRRAELVFVGRKSNQNYKVGSHGKNERQTEAHDS